MPYGIINPGECPCRKWTVVAHGVILNELNIMKGTPLWRGTLKSFSIIIIIIIIILGFIDSYS